MKRLSAWGLALAIVAALNIATSAQEAAKKKGQGPNPEQLKRMFSVLDANKDGKIEKSEVPEERMPLFERMLGFADQNKNGALDADEQKTLLERAAANAGGGGGGGAAGQPNALRLGMMDKDKDGKVSREEFTGPKPLFDRIDANKDGFITPEEARNLPGGGGGAPQPDPTMDPPKPTTGLVPLSELGKGLYQGKPGGLYPEGSNERPSAHEEAGLAIARSVRPLDAAGKPSDDGKIVLLSVGMSNTTQEFSAFKKMADSDPAKNPKLVVVDGAQGGMTAHVIKDVSTPRGQQYWQVNAERLEQAGVTPAQVQVAWLKEANARPTEKFPADAQMLSDEMGDIVRLLKTRFPNIKIVYLSSRIYGGYATTRLNPEPYAYQSGFAVKWLIEKQISGDASLNFDPQRGPVKAPWLSWGPYLWADGQKARSDGLTYAQSDLGPDGTHPSPGGGREKVAKQLLGFLKSDSTAKVWFVAPGQVNGKP